MNDFNETTAYRARYSEELHKAIYTGDIRAVKALMIYKGATREETEQLKIDRLQELQKQFDEIPAGELMGD